MSAIIIEFTPRFNKPVSVGKKSPSSGMKTVSINKKSISWGKKALFVTKKPASSGKGFATGKKMQ